MAIKESNVCVKVTLSKVQAEWLRKTAKKADMSVSKFISWILYRNIGNLLKDFSKNEKKIIENISEHPYTDEELKRAIEIAQVPWVNKD